MNWVGTGPASTDDVDTKGSVRSAMVRISLQRHERFGHELSSFELDECNVFATMDFSFSTMPTLGRACIAGRDFAVE